MNRPRDSFSPSLQDQFAPPDLELAPFSKRTLFKKKEHYSKKKNVNSRFSSATWSEKEKRVGDY